MNAMNPESLSDRTCDACDTRIEWGGIQTDAGHHYYHRYGVCQCEEREWYTQEYGSQPQRWTHPRHHSRGPTKPMNPSVCQIAPPVYERLRLTIPAREALERAGNQVRPMLCTQAELGIELYVVQQELGVPFYSITLVAPPAGLELVLIGQGDEQHRGLRLSDEPAYPGERVYPVSSHDHRFLRYLSQSNEY